MWWGFILYSKYILVWYSIKNILLIVNLSFKNTRLYKFQSALISCFSWVFNVNHFHWFQLVSTEWCEFYHQNIWIELINTNNSHHSFLYESSWNLIGFILVMSLCNRLKGLKSGDIAAFYLVWYGIGRFVIEGMRTDSLMLGPIRVSLALSLVLVAAGIILVLVNQKMSKYFLNKQ